MFEVTAVAISANWGAAFPTPSRKGASAAASGISGKDLVSATKSVDEAVVAIGSASSSEYLAKGRVISWHCKFVEVVE